MDKRVGLNILSVKFVLIHYSFRFDLKNLNIHKLKINIKNQYPLKTNQITNTKNFEVEYPLSFVFIEIQVYIHLNKEL